MAIVDLVMPKMGESIMEATILKCHKHPGDAVKMDETVLEIATDKVDSEVPSIAEGTIEEILFNTNDVVPVGAVIARVKTASGENVSSSHTSTQPQHPSEEYKQPLKETIAVPVHTVTASYTSQSGNEASNRFYSPLVLNIAASEGVSLSELEKVPGTGNEGRVTNKDILQYVSQRKTGARNVESGVISSNTSQQEVSVISESSRLTTQDPIAIGSRLIYSGNVEIIEMDRMRRLIADHMVRS